MKTKTYVRVLALLAGLLAFGGLAYADTCDLTAASPGDFCAISINGALFQEVDPQATGTGFVDPFVRLQATGTEAGYNTDGADAQGPFDDKVGIWTHDIQLQDLTVVNIEGTAYYAFVLDINEDSGSDHELISLDEIQIFTTDTGAQTTEAFDGGGLLDLINKNLVYQLDAGEDSVVELNYDINSGSGSGDMILYVPASFFAGVDPEDFVVLYSAFGDTTYSSSDGFEEWWAVVGQPVPEPATLILLGTGLVGVGAKLRRRMKKS